jgi:hypothetical protein
MQSAHYCCLILTKTGECPQISVKLPITKFKVNLFSSFCYVRQTDVHGQLAVTFVQLRCERG